METNEKLMTLLRLMDEPEAMNEAQLQELLADEEVRETYKLLADCKKVYQREEASLSLQDPPPALPVREGAECSDRQHSPSPKETTFSLTGRAGGESLHRIAAIFIAAAFIGGLAWAISPFLTSTKGEAPQSAEVSTTLPTREWQGGGSATLFSDVRLDSILTVVSAHYGKAVCFLDTAAQALRLTTTWDSQDSLAVFLTTLNEFDGLRLTDKHDTIFVESVAEED